MIAHVSGVPVEETLASITPVLLITLGAASATLRATHTRLSKKGRHGHLRRHR